MCAHRKGGWWKVETYYCFHYPTVQVGMEKKKNIELMLQHCEANEASNHSFLTNKNHDKGDSR